MKNNILEFKNKMMTMMSALLFFATILLYGNISQAKVAEPTVDATQTTPYTYNLAADQTSIIIPMSFSKAGVYTYKIEVTNFDSEVHFSTLKDSEAKDILSIGEFKGVEKEFGRIVEEPVLYYMFLYSDNPPALEKTVKVTCNYNEPQTEGRAISEGEKVRSVALDTLYYSFNLTSDSKITINGDPIWLCDANKKKLRSIVSEDENTIAYLKKGLYYIEAPKGIREFKYTAEKINFTNNTTKKKAKTIKVGKKVQMKFYATNKEESMLYYKFTLKKAKKISVSADLTKLHNSGILDLSIYKKKDRSVPFMHGYLDEKKGKIEFSGLVKKGKNNYFLNKKSVKLPAGTYYVAVSNTSGGDAVITVK